jgi:pimeloyl-ACP methyl ester carboxylesterase
MNKEIVIGDKKIFYRVEGDGKPVVLVHGFGETGEVWDQQVAFLKNQFRLIVPDLPGSGQSELIANMSMEGMADALKILLDTEYFNASPPETGDSETVIIGHSMGGYVTLAFAEKYPQYLKAIGLFHSTAFPDTEEKKATRRKGIEFMREHGAFAFLKNATPNLFSPATKAENQALIDGFLATLNNFSTESLVSYYESMIRRPDRTAVLKNTKNPVLLIMGKYDTAILLDDGLKLGKLPEKAYIHILSQSGHMGMLEEADRSNQLLQKFLTEAWAF